MVKSSVFDLLYPLRYRELTEEEIYTELCE